MQSVATRLVVERERERNRFVPAQWWDIEATFDPESFTSRLVSVDEKRVAQGRDFGPDGKPHSDEIVQLDEDGARGLAERLKDSSFTRRPRRAQAVRAPPESAVHDLDAAAGGEPQAPLHRADDDARRAAAVRERLHHLHAHRLDDAVGVGAEGRARQAAELFGAEYVPGSRAATSAR